MLRSSIPLYNSCKQRKTKCSNFLPFFLRWLGYRLNIAVWWFCACNWVSSAQNAQSIFVFSLYFTLLFWPFALSLNSLVPCTKTQTEALTHIRVRVVHVQHTSFVHWNDCSTTPRLLLAAASFRKIMYVSYYYYYWILLKPTKKENNSPSSFRQRALLWPCDVRIPSYSFYLRIFLLLRLLLLLLLFRNIVKCCCRRWFLLPCSCRSSCHYMLLLFCVSLRAAECMSKTRCFHIYFGTHTLQTHRVHCVHS